MLPNSGKSGKSAAGPREAAGIFRASPPDQQETFCGAGAKISVHELENKPPPGVIRRTKQSAIRRRLKRLLKGYVRVSTTTGVASLRSRLTIA